MTTKKIFIQFVAAILVFSSCQKNIDQFIPDPGQVNGPDSTWYNSITNTMPVSNLKTNLLLELKKDSFEFNSTSTITINTGSGLQCSFIPGTVISSSNLPVTGKVHVESLLLRKKGDIIRMGTPTTSNGSMLVSGGEILVRLLKDGVPVQIAQNGHYYLKFNDTPISGLMSLFNGIETGPTTFNWLPNTDTVNNRVVASPNQSYEIMSNHLQWINCDYFFDTTGIQRTIVSATLPAHYTNANTVAYTVFNDVRSVIGMYGNESTRKFSTGKLPVNKQVTVVVISKQGNDYYLGHEQALTAIGNAGTIGFQQVQVNPVKTSFDNIITYLNTL